MNNIDTTLIGKYIKSIRLSKGWSQAKLEYLSGISASSISNIEHGNKGISYNMSIPAIVKIAHAFQMSFYDILNDSGFLAYIGDQQFAQNKSQIYITNHELINLFNRLSPSEQQKFVKEIYLRVELSDKQKQQNMFKKL
ncbi:helix-turn-helix domain-containing protein [Thomasclavelia saccharogumia]|uniref:helix-turn-helix domain-containing protein n=1 Tax=Thomasclavelia saccharogumia TaxID=341225 RepID=UPI00047A70E3|nr:helix-turn-helix transcriptional regulator [Thomasclavelia saccharogumia]